MGFIDVSAANGIQESGGRQTHSRGRKPPVWGKENRSSEAPERTRRQRGPTESVALNMPCAHIRSRRSWLRAYTLALICRPSASSAAPQALQGSISFSCVTGGSHLRLRLDEPSPATFCRPPDSQIRLAARAVLGRDENGLRRGEECPLGMVKNLPAADGEEQLAL